MHLVQLLLPLVGEREVFDEVMHEPTERDDIYRRALEKRLRQKELVVRAHEIEAL